MISFQEDQGALCESESAQLEDLKSQMLAHHDTLSNQISRDDTQRQR
jgi:chromosome segregation ATPase